MISSIMAPVTANDLKAHSGTGVLNCNCASSEHQNEDPYNSCPN